MQPIGIAKKVDNLGRIVIPKEYRDLYNIKESGMVYVLGTENGLLIRNERFKAIEHEQPKDINI